MQQKDNQLKGMADQVREAEETVKRERKKAEERVATVEREFNEKERNLMDKIKREMNNLI
jgi:hypothetical protein